MSRPLESTTLALAGQHLIEASAGTGKTYNIALLYLRLLLERGLGVRQIAVVTFTDAATRELRGRLRERIAQALDRLQGPVSGVPDDLDRILGGHRADMASLDRAKSILSSALVGFDEARVSTLHGLCRQLLADVAFETGMPFIELDNNAGNEAAQELVRDFWRRYVVAEPDEAVAAVLQRWKTPTDLASDLLRSQVLALPATRIDPADPQAWVERSRASLAAAAASWRIMHADGRVDAALQQLRDAIASKQLNSAKASPLGAPSIARCVAACASDPGKVEFPALAALRTRSIQDGISARARNSGWTPATELAEVSACVEILLRADDEMQNALLARFNCAAIGFVRAGLAAHRERQRRFGYDDLVSQLHDELHGASGQRIALRVAEEIPALLVDEFQDTDPQQYAILRRIHEARADAVLLLIGDPKQAIYRFRGGDIHTYHAAARDAGANRHTLRENWRSDATLIAAANSVFDGVDDPFLVDFIAFEPACFPAAKDQARHWLSSEAPLTVWRLPDQANAKGEPRPWTVGAFADRVLAEVCREVRNLLSQARDKGQDLPGIAVLVNSNRQAEATARELAQWNIACDYLSTESVHASAEAIEIERLLAALDAPGDAGRVRAALATELLGEDLQGLRAAQDDLAVWEAQLGRIAALRQRWFEAGPYATIAHCVQQAATRLLPRWDGRRRITNLLHLAELLQQESTRRPAPAELLHWLGQRRNEAIDQRGEGAAEQLRPADDPGAVQVLTVHRSKGLQYDVVFAPFAMGMRWTHPERLEQPDEAVSWHAGDELRVDVGGPDWTAHALAQRDEQFAESLRLAYVAITRARHRVWLAWAWANTSKAGTSQIGPLSWLWFRQPAARKPEQLEQAGMLVADIDAALANLARRSAHSIRIELLDPDVPAIDPLPNVGGETELVVAEFHGRIERRLETLSYSRLFGGGQHAPLADHDEASNPLAVVSDVVVEDPVPQWPRGAEFGNCVHEVFEEVPFAELARPGLHPELVRICGNHGYVGEDQAIIAAMARACVRTELLPEPALTLMGLDGGESLAELEFLFPLGAARLELFEAILAGYPAYARGRGELVVRRSAVRGLMTGFIDLVLRWQDRYYVLDYKTNLLGASRTAYAPDALPSAIRAHDYDLQYLVYLVALQRFLRSRLGDAYDYERHVGGALYLFVRGMRVGERAGIHHDRPPAALIDALDAWCGGAAP